jgi:hypothetical protein
LVLFEKGRESGRERKKGMTMGGARFKWRAEVGNGSAGWHHASGVEEGTRRGGWPARGPWLVGASGGGAGVSLGHVPTRIGESGGWQVGPWSISFKFEIQTHSNLTDLNLTFASSKNLEKYGCEDLKKWTTFSIETSSDSEGIRNENSGKSLGLGFDII